VAPHVALLRGINLGKVNRIPMARLREVLAEAGYDGAVTHLQSGNVVVQSRDSSAKVAGTVERAIEAEWGLDVPVIVRSEAQLAKVVAADPFAGVADDPARYLVTFLSGKPSPKALAGLDPADYEPERFELRGSELYCWLPGGVHASKLMKALSKADSSLVGTARNWRTVTKLLELTDQGRLRP
jgi:uncharacterized protein (DUF1697 family)